MKSRKLGAKNQTAIHGAGEHSLTEPGPSLAVLEAIVFLHGPHRALRKKESRPLATASGRSVSMPTLKESRWCTASSRLRQRSGTISFKAPDFSGSEETVYGRKNENPRVEMPGKGFLGKTLVENLVLKAWGARKKAAARRPPPGVNIPLKLEIEASSDFNLPRRVQEAAAVCGVAHHEGVGAVRALVLQV